MSWRRAALRALPLDDVGFAAAVGAWLTAAAAATALDDVTATGIGMGIAGCTIICGIIID
jgi:hypothetical protein